MFDVAGGARCPEDVAQRRGYSDRSNAARSNRAGKQGTLIGGYRTGINASTQRGGYRAGVMLYVIHV
jgi:hypothetical protein